jgi:hypothetical protein
MLDEDGRVLRGLRAEGPALLRCGGYALFMLMLGDPSDWPEAAGDAWDMLPERVYFDELERCPNGSVSRMRQVHADASHQSIVMRTMGPRDTESRLTLEGGVAGTLELVGPSRRTTITVGHNALRDGVLLGRYSRCDAVGPDDGSLSRVHALLLHDDDRLLVVDTASFNGTRVVGHEHARMHVLDGDVELELGRKTRMRWRWAAS